MISPSTIYALLLCLQREYSLWFGYTFHSEWSFPQFVDSRSILLLAIDPMMRRKRLTDAQVYTPNQYHFFIMQPLENNQSITGCGDHTDVWFWLWADKNAELDLR
ncbi:MAG: hypothetical protein WBM41_06935 [Arenicellales bacterium]